MLRLFGRYSVQRFLARVSSLKPKHTKQLQIRSSAFVSTRRLNTDSCFLVNCKTISIQKRVISISNSILNSKKNDNDNNDDNSKNRSSSRDDDEDNEDDEDIEEDESKDNAEQNLPAAVSIPEVWPHLPLLAIRMDPIFPRFVRLLEISDMRLVNIIVRKVSLGQPYVGIFLKKDREDKSEVVDSLDEVYSVGSFAHIKEIQDVDGKVRLVVESHRRIKITGQIFDENVKPRKLNAADYEEKEKELADILSVSKQSEVKTTPDGVLMVEVENLKNKPYEITVEVKALTQEIIKTLRDIFTINPIYRETINYMLYHEKNLFDDLAYLCDVSAFISAAEPTELQKVLEEVEVPKRLLLVLGLLKKQLELSTLQAKIGKQVEERVKEHHRKYMLQQQMKVIKKELGIEKNDKDAIHERYMKNLNDKKIPNHVMEIIDEELNKLNFLETHSVEFNVSRNYLDWLTNMPWGITSEENLDLKKAADILNCDHYGMDEVKNRILEFIAVSFLKKSTQGKILCLHGPPGVGKTSIALSIAKALNREYCRFSVGGLTDVAEIKGHRRTYVGAMPGKIIQCLKKTNTENPIILIDEIDKMSRSYQGDPASALLELLDPEQNVNFLDHYLDVPVDLSHILFICTANQIELISEPLRDRMELIEMSGYIAEEKISIARRYLLPNAMNNAGLSNEQVKVEDAAIQAIIKHYCRESGVRNLQKHIEKIVRKVAYKIVQQEDSCFDINEENLADFIGKEVFTSDRLYNVTPPGVVMGLAWTVMGGSALYIETMKRIATPYRKNAPMKVHTTGNLGAVMRESAQIALTVAGNFIGQIDQCNNVLQTSEIHVHIPEGATPKDGPSAGITITTALISLALNKRVRPDIAMTGEISLTGRVLKVGGIKEKVIAAKRSGINCIVLPHDNKRDFEELPDFIKDGISASFVSNYKDIYDIVFV